MSGRHKNCVCMKFTVEYHTVWGENLVLRQGSEAWPMSYQPGGMWTVEVAEEDFFHGREEAEYFYEVLCDGLSVRHEWRVHKLTRPSAADVTDSWSDIPGWKGAGTAIPVFALRSGDDFGVGEFHDLRKLIDWAALTGQSFIQLLPVNDTSKDGSLSDSYPYNAVSSFALHPQFIHLPDAGVTVDDEYLRLQKELNSFVRDGRPETDYVRVNAEKHRLLRAAYDASGHSLAGTEDYRAFVAANESWLLPYAVFSVLCRRFGTADFSRWGEWSEYDADRTAAFAKSAEYEVGYVYFLQYHLDRQLAEVRNYAHEKGLVLKGDLPIGVSRNSADTWQFPHLFNMDSQAGAPPDVFSTDGQNWGFPTYNWEAMSRDGYSWWKARLAKMDEYFDATRIDHLLGFFRIWEIPMPLRSGLEGHFSPALPYSREELISMGYGRRLHLFVEDPHRPGWYHPRIDAHELGSLHEDFFWRRHNEFWAEHALNKLSALLGSTNMLACGEDLGMIPPCVPGVMKRLNILSLEIQRMSKDPSLTFARPSQYPYPCVCTTSTHDMNPLRAWWEEDRALTQRFYNEELGCQGEAPECCEPWICRRIVAQHLASPAMLAILPLQDWLSIDGELRYRRDSSKGWNGLPEDERINIPAVPNYHWDYRIHISLEELLSAETFNREIADLIKDSGRHSGITAQEEKGGHPQV